MDAVSRAARVVEVLRDLATDAEGAKLIPREQTAVTLGALGLEMLDVEQLQELMAKHDDLFEGYCQPGAGG